MAGVDHAYQYSVEVKSRFSLFMDDSLNNEDPDILMSKLQNERVERSKKDKVPVLPVVKTEKKPEKEPETTSKNEKSQAKSQPVHTPKLAKPAAQEENVEIIEQEKSAVPPAQVFRGRGNYRGFGRGFRGFRGHPRAHQGDFPVNGTDATQRDGAHESRVRERYRQRGGFYRGRPMNTDVRELPADQDNVSHDQQVHRGDEAQSTWNGSPEENELATSKSSATAATEEASTENQDNKEEEKEEEEAPTYTLEEYKAMRSLGKPAVTLANKGTRKPNDGEDVFANMVAHRKIVEVVEDEFVKVEMEEEQPEQFEINVLFNDDLGSRGRQSRGFGNRGFIRGGRARGRPRMDRGGRGTFRGDARGHYGTPRVIYNDQEFPSLK